MSLIKYASIQIKKSHEGLLHENMHVPIDKKISVSSMKAELKSASSVEKKRLIFAMNARKWHHKGN